MKPTENTLRELIREEAKRHLNKSRVRSAMKFEDVISELKSFDPPESFRILKRHERRYVMNN